MRQKIKISFIKGNLGQGGAERQFLELIKNIDKEKFEVYVCLYAINKGIFYTEIEQIKNIYLIENIIKHKIKFLKIIEALIFINKYLSKNANIQIIICQYKYYLLINYFNN